MAAMAEILAAENPAAATDRRFGDQGIEPGQLMGFGQNVGIEDEAGFRRHHLEARESLQSRLRVVLRLAVIEANR